MHSLILPRAKILRGSICLRANLHTKGHKNLKIKIVSGNQSLMEVIAPLISFSSGQGEFAWFAPPPFSFSPPQCIFCQDG